MTVRNSLRLSDPNTHRHRVRQLVITDVDNTLYDFGTYFEAGLTGLVSAAAAALNQPERYIVDTLQEVFTARRSIEYPFPLADFPEAHHMSTEERRDLVRLTSNAFWAQAEAALKPYPGVIATLRHLRNDGVDIVAFTDAPIHEATRRLRSLDVDRYLSGVVATQWFDRRALGTPVIRLAEIPGFVKVRRSLSVVGRLKDGERKPNPETYLQIMKAFGLTPDRVTVIGDSPARDLVPAAALGMQAVWARYGRRNPAAEILLQQIVPFKLPEIAVLQDAAASGFPAVDSFDGLLDFLPTQLVLPLRFA